MKKYAQIKRMMIILFLLLPAGLYSQHPVELRTWWEKSGFTETPRYEQTIEYSRKLDEASPWISCQVFGRSPQGRDLPLLILDSDGFSTPEEVNKSGKLKILVQACIHAGEPEGKDAGLALFRDIALRYKKMDIDGITILFIPIFNVDGHERFTPYSRINQNGPKEAGWRTTAVNLNLNRDYLKADTPEMQAWLQLFNKWDPDFFIDCHTTDGADYQYPITMEYDGFHNQLLDQWLSVNLVPRLTMAMETSGFPVFNYVSFRKWHDPRSGLIGQVPGPRFSTGYVAARNRFALLIETHMLKDYKIRVQATYALLDHTLSIVATEIPHIKNIIRTADSLTASSDFRKSPCLLDCAPSMSDSMMVAFRGVDYTVEKSDLTGGNWYKYGTKPTTYTLPLFSRQVPTLQVNLPEAYLIPAEWQEVIIRLGWHGIRYEVLPEDDSIMVESYRLTNPRWAASPYEGRQILESFTMDTIHMKRAFHKGSVKIPVNQPNARLIAFMLEPLTDESFLRWGFFNAIFEEKEYVETYVMEKMAREMIRENPGLKAEFEKLRNGDPAFAADSYDQLLWFYRKTPYYDQSVGLYPVGKLAW